MIHQCYFEPSQRPHLFTSPLYRGFGLYTAVNPDLARNCPELADPKNQQALSEYAALLHLWRNPDLDDDPWIGFSSYRQLDKFPTILEDRQALEGCLARCDVVGWGFYAFFDASSGRPISLAEQGERFHPGITSALWRLLLWRDEALPANYLLENSGLFCNYWVMSKSNFDEYMRWSWPLVQGFLEHPDSFSQSHARALAYLVERLFICWYGLRQKRLVNVGQTVRLPCGNPARARTDLEGRAAGQEELVALGSWNVTLLELCLCHRAMPRGIIHVGVPSAEQRETYRLLGGQPVLCIEADQERMSRLRVESADDPDKYDFLVLDAQGAELAALRELDDHLRQFNGAFLKVYLEPPSAGCARMPEIDAFLRPHGLTRRETLMTLRGCGDALYLRAGAYEGPPSDLATRVEQARSQLVLRRSFTFHQLGHERRALELLEGGQIGAGQGPEEQVWLLRGCGHDVVLEMVGSHGRTCCLRPGQDGTWRGASLVLAGLPVELIPGTETLGRPTVWKYPHDTNLPLELAENLRDAGGLQTFVETGTALGTTARMMAARFAQVYTTELDPVLYRKAAAELTGHKNVRCFLGDSVRFLAAVLPGIDGPALCWLDAHWSGTGTARGDPECPLLAELEVIYAQRADHVVLIDDARLLLAPPPPPHRPWEWPTFRDLSAFFRRQAPAPFVRVVGDVIVAAPAAMAGVIEAYCRGPGMGGCWAGQ